MSSFCIKWCKKFWKPGQKVDVDYQTGCRAPVHWSKYTTSVLLKPSQMVSQSTYRPPSTCVTSLWLFLVPLYLKIHFHFWQKKNKKMSFSNKDWFGPITQKTLGFLKSNCNFKHPWIDLSSIKTYCVMYTMLFIHIFGAFRF